MNKWPRPIAIDFDGVIHQATSKWTCAEEIHDGPVPGAFEFIERVFVAYGVVIFTARANAPKAIPAIRAWFFKHGMDPGLVERLFITANKPHALVYIDDRGWRFQGTFPTIVELDRFEPWRCRPGDLPEDMSARRSIRERVAFVLSDTRGDLDECAVRACKLLAEVVDELRESIPTKVGP